MHAQKARFGTTTQHNTTQQQLQQQQQQQQEQQTHETMCWAANDRPEHRTRWYIERFAFPQVSIDHSVQLAELRKRSRAHPDDKVRVGNKGVFFRYISSAMRASDM